MPRHLVTALGMGALIAACDGGAPIEPIDRAEAGVLRFDAAMLQRDAGVADGAPPGADGGPGPGGDTRRFVPDIPITYAGMMASPGVELVGWTIREDPVLRDHTFVLAVRNTYGSPLCSLTVDVEFFDATGVRIGDAGTLVEGPPHRGCYGDCGFVGCISDDEVGMYAAPLYLTGGRAADEIARGTFVTGGINLIDGVHTSDIAVAGVMTAPGTFRGQHFVGRVENRSGARVRNPQVWIFGLNAVGRPLFGTRDIEIVDIFPGSSWSFSTHPDFEEEYVSYVAFAEASDP